MPHPWTINVGCMVVQMAFKLVDTNRVLVFWLLGTLSKWTNYIHGWQDRFFALKEGTLVYYKSQLETDFGCRGAITVDKATVKPHEVQNILWKLSTSESTY